jgi:hypothetical protein
VPSEIRVSIVEVPCRRLTQAARWKGQAPQTTTGAANVRESHCQLSNCHGETIASRITGTVRTADTSTRSRQGRLGSSSSTAVSAPSSCAAGSVAAYPACATVSTSCSGVNVSGKVTFAFSVA